MLLTPYFLSKIILIPTIWLKKPKFTFSKLSLLINPQLDNSGKAELVRIKYPYLLSVLLINCCLISLKEA